MKAKEAADNGARVCELYNDRRSGRVRLGIYDTGMDSAGSRGTSTIRGGRLSGKNYTDAVQKENSIWTQMSSRVLALAGEAEEEAKNFRVTGAGEENPEAAVMEADGAEADRGKRSEAYKIFEAASAGKENPISNFRVASKVPYGHLAKDGVITYNGVTFVCDEKTNSICLGNVDDKSQVITVTLSGGGHLKVNRKNIGELSRAAGMFSPEDLNLIMRAIAQDTKIQSVKKEIDDMENSIGSAENAISGEEISEDATSENPISGEAADTDEER